MKIAFHITGYKKPDQFNWLYKSIYNKSDLFIIHVDKKSPPEVHHGFRSIAKKHDNTHFIESIPIIWGGTGLIRAELSAIKEALRIDADWRYWINLTAQDYPLVSLDELRAKLHASWPGNFVECKALPDVHWRIRKRLWFRYIKFGNRRYFTPIPRLSNARVQLNWYGAWWHILSRDFCGWWSTAARAAEYYEALETAGMPDEFLVQNVIHDSPYRETVISECKHEIVWCGPDDPLSSSAHPNILTMHDRQLLLRSGAFFARKFDQEVDKKILSELAKQIGMSPLERCSNR
jgi:hypothetical protein